MDRRLEVISWIHFVVVAVDFCRGRIISLTLQTENRNYRIISRSSIEREQNIWRIESLSLQQKLISYT